MKAKSEIELIFFARVQLTLRCTCTLTVVFRSSVQFCNSAFDRQLKQIQSIIWSNVIILQNTYRRHDFFLILNVVTTNRL